MFKIPNEYSEAMNRKRDNKTAKRNKRRKYINISQQNYTENIVHKPLFNLRNVIISCSTCDTRRVIYVANPLISHITVKKY
jgi:hypothetical protein